MIIVVRLIFIALAVFVLGRILQMVLHALSKAGKSTVENQPGPRREPYVDVRDAKFEDLPEEKTKGETGPSA